VTREPGGRTDAIPVLTVPISILSVALLLLLSFLLFGPGLVLGETPSSSAARCYVKITSVTGLTWKSLSSTITIRGECFGTDPHYISLAPYGYTGEDTYDCGGAIDGPSLVIHDWGPGNQTWAVGHFFGHNGICTGTNAGGLFYHSWNNTTIVIHGFGDALGSPGSGATWKMYPGNPCSVQITHNHNGSRYNYTIPAGDC
jgi:hypothetical protein